MYRRQKEDKSVLVSNEVLPEEDDDNDDDNNDSDIQRTRSQSSLDDQRVESREVESGDGGGAGGSSGVGGARRENAPRVEVGARAECEVEIGGGCGCGGGGGDGGGGGGCDNRLGSLTDSRTKRRGDSNNSFSYKRNNNSEGRRDDDDDDDACDSIHVEDVDGIESSIKPDVGVDREERGAAAAAAAAAVSASPSRSKAFSNEIAGCCISLNQPEIPLVIVTSPGESSIAFTPVSPRPFATSLVTAPPQAAPPHAAPPLSPPPLTDPDGRGFRPLRAKDIIVIQIFAALVCSCFPCTGLPALLTSRKTQKLFESGRVEEAASAARRSERLVIATIICGFVSLVTLIAVIESQEEEEEGWAERMRKYWRVSDRME